MTSTLITKLCYKELGVGSKAKPR